MNATLLSPDRTPDEWNIPDSDMHDNGNSSSSFEFPKGDKAIAKSGAVAAMHHRFGPSKWDDAEKWLANPLYTSKLKIVTLHGHNLINPSKQLPAHSVKDGVVPSSNGASHVSRDDASVPLLNGREAPHSYKDDVLSLNGDGATTRREADLHRLQAICEEEPSDMKELSVSHEDVNEDKPAEPPAWDRASYVMPEPTMRSVSMRDMGTEMTPIASQEPSRTGTPIQATTPLMRSPVSSGSSTPRRAAPASSPLQTSQDPTQSPGNNLSIPDTDGTTSETCEGELQMKARKDMQTLGVQLGKLNIAPWAGKEEEDGDSSKLLKNIDLEEVKKNMLETRAAAWEEAEEAKYIARFEREEAKIQAWENHEKAKAEAEMRRIEVKIEKIRSHAHEKLMNKLAAAKRGAEERRAVAEARRSEQAAKTVIVANRIRRTGRVPSQMLGCAFCP
ncbi:hypothetical protein GOP47_0013681 [Adiantum capillus-veneris]|uniref:Remorin C-terminal domain-containing protein n=1 Tax=Adiantum capillus-veneris TaxID=13818 RepID=A0A9D4UNZ8_ADICA|nr:hypothetical protein GOP47_0013681 [Adiantum capillus-veneris]